MNEFISSYKVRLIVSLLDSYIACTMLSPSPLVFKEINNLIDDNLPRLPSKLSKDRSLMNKQTDCQKTLEALRSSGTAGIHSFDLNHIVGTTRAAARINDLKAQGYVITSVYEKRGDSHGCRYFLNSSPAITTKELKKIVKGPELIKKPIRYEYVGNTAIPIYQ